MKLAITPFLTLLLGLAGAGIFYVTSQSVSDTIWLGVGILIGLVLLILDERVFSRWYVETENAYLITRSPLFGFTYLPLAIFVVTSAGSSLGNGLILGIGIQLWSEMILTYRHPEQFAARFLTQFGRPVSETEIVKIVGGFTIFVVLLSLAVIWK